MYIGTFLWVRLYACKCSAFRGQKGAGDPCVPRVMGTEVRSTVRAVTTAEPSFQPPQEQALVAHLREVDTCFGLSKNENKWKTSV